MDTSLETERSQLLAIGAGEYYSSAANQLILRADTETVYRAVVAGVRERGYFLIAQFANDERELTDDGFNLYTLFSHPSLDLMVTLVLPLGRGVTTYPSVRSQYAAALPFECELAKGFGLMPSVAGPPPSGLRRPTDPHDGYPLHRSLSTADWRAALEQPPAEPALVADELPAGELELPIGPIHAGVIGAGHFRFRVNGEVIEDVNLHLGYTQRGVERLFQTHFTLQDGWKLAQQVTGDSIVAHTLAYCQALETLGSVTVPQPAQWLRALALELERLHNHMNDCAMLAHDVALDLPAAQMLAGREGLLRLNAQVGGHRLLRGLIGSGGARLPAPLNVDVVRTSLRQILKDFLPPARCLLTHPGFRARTIGVGALPLELAERVGAIGLVARASGLKRDMRQLQPVEPLDRQDFQALLNEAAHDEDVYVERERAAGDAFARYATRVTEIAVSARIIEGILDHWDRSWLDTDYLRSIDLRGVPNYRFAFGCVEGWRGPVVYWLMKDKFQRIYRCKVGDPSTLNWPALKAAMDSRTGSPGQPERYEMLLADFPIINKSFNLSYTGTDL